MSAANDQRLAEGIRAVVKEEEGAAMDAGNAVREIAADHMTVSFLRHSMDWEAMFRHLERQFAAFAQRVAQIELAHPELLAEMARIRADVATLHPPAPPVGGRNGI